MEVDAVRGHLESLILAVLEDHPAHGYAVIESVRARTGGHLQLNTGSVYPALRRLEAAGQLSGDWALVDGRRRRTYRITAHGRRELAGHRSRWAQFTSVVGGLLEGGST